MSDIVDTSPLGIERTERIAGDDALNNRLDTVTTELQGTQESVTTEVLHRSEGDLVIQRILEGYIQELLEGKSEELDRYLNFQGTQNSNYTEVKNFITGIRYAIAEEVRLLADSMNANLALNDTRFNKLTADVSKYLTLLGDITLDSNQITLDNGELRAGAWTILSQARQWDLEIINRINTLGASVGSSIQDAVEELQNSLPSTEQTIGKAIEELSKSAIITDLSNKLTGAIDSTVANNEALRQQAYDTAVSMQQLASSIQTEVAAGQSTISAMVSNEISTRTLEILKERNARLESIQLLEDGFTESLNVISEENAVVLTQLQNYKSSTDSSLANILNELSVQTDYNTTNTVLTTALDARLTIAEQDADTAKTLAASAVTKANTAVTQSTATAERLDALEASLSESDGTEVDVNAFNTLKGIVTNQGNVLSGVVEDVTGLTATIQDLSGNKADVSALNNFFTKAEFETESKRVAAGEVSSFSSSLIIGGSNLVKQSNVPAVSPVNSGASQVHGIYQLYENTSQIFDKAQLKSVGYLSVSFDWEVKDTLQPSGNFVCSLYGEPQTLLSESITVGPGNIKGHSTYSFKVPPSWKEHQTDKVAFIRNGFNGSLSISQLKVEIGSKATGWSPANADIDDQLQANATAVSGLTTLVEEIEGQLNVSAESLERLEVKVNPPKASGSWKISSSRKTATSASLRSLQIKDDKVLAKRIDDLYASVGDNLAQITESLVAEVTTINGKVTAHTTSLELLTTKIGDNSATLIVQNRTLDGVLAESTIKTDVNGLVRGIGFINDGKRAAFGVAADDFFVEQAGRKPFLVTAGATVNGVTYPAGTWIDVAMIANATIGTAHIANASITNAKIKDLDASKITTGVLDAQRVRVGSTTQFESGFNPAVALAEATAAKNAAGTAQYTANSAHDNLALWKYPNSTYIDGGKIYTNSITANQIDASVFRSVGTDGSSSYISGGTIRAYYPNGNIAFHIGVS